MLHAFKIDGDIQEIYPNFKLLMINHGCPYTWNLSQIKI